MTRRSLQVCVITALLLGCSTPVEAVEVSGGVGLGGILTGTLPRFAVSPHVAVSWTTSSGFLFAAHEMVSILPPLHDDGVGVYEQTSAVIGYAGETWNFSVGPSLSIFSMPACGATLCGRVVGLAPGGHVQVNRYFLGPLGVSVNAALDWVGGTSLVLPGGAAGTVVAGPVLRWTPE